MNDYAEKLKDPRWQRKRLYIFERDKWACRCCEDKETTLTIHHLKYLPGLEPWEYPDDLLLTLCEPCHEAWIIKNGIPNYRTMTPNEEAERIALLKRQAVILLKKEVANARTR